MEKNALLSVYHKIGIAEFALELVTFGWRIFSSGGTAKTLREAGVSVTDVAELSGLPAILGHRVVTLVPQVHGGLLAAEEHREELHQLGYPWFDLVCVDLYPLKEEVRRSDATQESIIEKIRSVEDSLVTNSWGVVGVLLATPFFFAPKIFLEHCFSSRRGFQAPHIYLLRTIDTIARRSMVIAEGVFCPLTVQGLPWAGSKGGRR